MSDPPNLKQASIPHWQQQENSQISKTSNEESTSPEAPEPANSPPSRAALLEQASKFLTEDEIKDAPTERKIAFLETKGLTEEEIHRLLDLPSGKPNAEAHEEAGTEEAVRRPLHIYSTSHVNSYQHIQSTASTLPSFQPEIPISIPPAQSSPSTDMPPIITYPEFLLHSRKPPPLITASNLINTIYLFSGTAAAIYGTSKYIVDPMLESLTFARRSFYETAQNDLNTLNAKLEKIVSRIADGVAKGAEEGEEAGGDDDSDTTEDIGPLFNRTIGTQTSPPLSPGTSSTASPEPPPLDTISAHESSLKSLQTSLASLLPTSEAQRTGVSDVKSQMSDLKSYLNGLAYPTLYTDNKGAVESKDDAVNKFKSEVRGVKGVLLSARNFPSGTGRVG